MLRLAGSRPAARSRMADERAICDHVVPRITEAATRAGRPAPRIVAGVPVALCSNDETDDARAYASEVLGHADFSPNYVRLLEHGDAQDVGDTMAAGDDRPSSLGCAATATRVSPILRRELSRWARTQPNGPNRDGGPRSFCRHLCPACDRRHQRDGRPRTRVR